MARPPSDRRPKKQTQRDDVFFTHTVRDESSEWTENGIGPFEARENHSPVGFVGDIRDIGSDGGLHGRQHLPVQIVENRDWKKKGDYEPAIPERAACGRVHRGGCDLKPARTPRRGL